MRSKLFPIPGEERKFRRRRIVAFLPACKREREAASSHAVAGEGVSPTGEEMTTIGGSAFGTTFCTAEPLDGARSQKQ